MPDAGRDNPAVCPRRGYDLRGVVAMWRESCPMDGRCAECGLRFEWAEVIGARAPRPGWCVEYAARWWGVPWRSAKTFVVALWPWGFWKSLRMTHEVRWGRIAAYLALLVVPLYLFVCVCHGVVAWAEWQSYSRAAFAPMPPPFVVVAQSILLPYSNSSPGQMRAPGRSLLVPFPPPSQQPRVDWGALRQWAQLPPFLGVVLLCPAGFLVLPVSRRRAKVRYAHIHRVTLYSMAFMLVPVAGLPTELLLRYAAQSTRVAEMLWGAVFGAMLGFPALLVPWWSCATGRYLKIRHAWGVGLAVVVMAALGTALVLTLVALIATKPG